MGREPAGEFQSFRTLVALLLGVRLLYAAMVQLVPDEAFYWVWSRHLAWGYFDHPPVIAYLIWLGTHLLGSVEIGVRLAAVLMAIGAMVVTVMLARRVLREERAALWVAAMWLTSPLLAGIGTFFTPDTPAAFFSVCALAFAAMIADRDDHPAVGVPPQMSDAWLWLLFGLFTGLALLSKYTAVLLPTSVALAMLFSRKGRGHFRKPWIYLAGVVALLLFSPDIGWNFSHNWASFRFQLQHGTESGASLGMTIGRAYKRFWRDLGVYLGGQAGVWTPILFVMGIVVLIIYWRRYSRTSQVDRLLLWSGTLPLVFFGVMFVRSHHGEANWPALAYFPISILTARWLSEKWDGRRLEWAHGGVRLALGIVISMHVILLPRVTNWMLQWHVKLPHALSDVTGWREYGRAIANEANRTGVPVVTNRHQDAAEAAFYMPGQPEVWCDGIGSRPTAFDYFDDRPDFAKIPAVLWVGGHVDLFRQKYGYIVQTQTNVIFFGGRNERTVNMYLLTRPQR